MTKVGPAGISADTIPYWMVLLRVLGQPVGYVCIPNRHLEEAAMLPGARDAGVGIKDAAEAGGGKAGVAEKGAAEGAGMDLRTSGDLRALIAEITAAETTGLNLRTLGDLRDLICERLDLPTDRVELWIAPPEIHSRGTLPSTRGDGDIKGHTDSGILPEKPRGDKALLDSMGLEYYGLQHQSVVDVRLKPEARESGSDGSEAMGAEDVKAGGGEETGGAGGQDDIVRIAVKTNRMMTRGEEGAVRVFFFVFFFACVGVGCVVVAPLGGRVVLLQQTISGNETGQPLR